MEKTWTPKIIAELTKRVGQRTKQSCPECGAVMVIRKNRHNDSFFLGCNRFPECTGLMELPESLKLEILGFQKLAGF